MGNETVTPVTISSTTPSSLSSTVSAAAGAAIGTAQRSTTPKQQSVGDSSSTGLNQPPASPARPASRTTSLPLSVDNDVQITESEYIERIQSINKDILDPSLFSLELEEISDCYHQSIHVFFLVSSLMKTPDERPFHRISPDGPAFCRLTTAVAR